MTVSSSNPDRLPIPPDDLGPIIRVGGDRRLEAVRRLVDGGVRGDPDHARRFLETSASMGISLDDMFARLNATDRIVATVLAVRSPGRTAMLFASRLRHHEDVRSLSGVIAHVGACLDEQSVTLAQALLDPSEVLEHRAFIEGGFTELAALSYLERPIPARRQVSRIVWPTDVRVEPYDASLRDDVVALLEATYIETRDCPGLLGVRDTSDIFDGHQATGEFDSSLWTLLFIDDVISGVLMLNPSISSQSVELVYIGLAPHARGRGLGTLLLQHGLSLISGRSERSVTLAVDDDNTPALAMYKREGFRRFLRRRALIRAVAHNSREFSTDH